MRNSESCPLSEDRLISRCSTCWRKEPGCTLEGAPVPCQGNGKEMKLSGKMSDHDAAKIVKEAQIVNQHKIPRIWILIADASTAKVLKREGEKLEVIAGMQPTFSHSSNLKDKAEPYAHDTHKNGKDFASEIALWLDNAVRSNSYDRLVLVAAPRMLGHLRHAISHNVHDRIVAQVDKDLTKMPEHDLKAELAKIVWF